MSKCRDKCSCSSGDVDHSRRGLLKGIAAAGVGAVGMANPAVGLPAWGGKSFQDAWADFFQKHYQRKHGVHAYYGQKE